MSKCISKDGYNIEAFCRLVGLSVKDVFDLLNI